MPTARILARSSVMSNPAPQPHYGIIVPVKPPAIAKSRLSGLGDDLRRDLVVAFAADTILAAAQSPLVDVVLAVTDDHQLARTLSELGALVIPDGTTDDLNGTLLEAAYEVRRQRPELRVAALCADLPALRADDLTRALVTAPPSLSFVADRAGVGTTLLVAPTPELFTPRFGPDSRDAHLDAGAVDLDIADIASLRHDVDTPADLMAALELGVGPRTSTVVTGLTL